MAQMSNYCKAYPAHELRQFQEWHEQSPPLVVRPEGQSAAEEIAYFYLHDNYVVTAGLHRDENIAFDHVTDAWKSFCHGVLDFAVPDAGRTSSS